MNTIYVNINGNISPEVNDYVYCYFLHITLCCKALTNKEIN